MIAGLSQCEERSKPVRESGKEAPENKMSAQKRTGLTISQAQDDLIKARCAACIYPTAFQWVP
ncbi:uncharacterized protein N7479_010210 [Penicillium vulpinum]|uniref:uncharacterized protein n=1 Tax=Penicillium vulpinum TaxID=29845 RepID=UPI00254986B9|nr:uncharacterized protein N7479_010210 [Penicillium vulpinum]KAJ5951797.1 hypothetical protein N7479_010210 [Penicillium vulpinum]